MTVPARVVAPGERRYVVREWKAKRTVVYSVYDRQEGSYPGYRNGEPVIQVQGDQGVAQAEADRLEATR